MAGEGNKSTLEPRAHISAAEAEDQDMHHGSGRATIGSESSKQSRSDTICSDISIISSILKMMVIPIPVPPRNTPSKHLFCRRKPSNSSKPSNYWDIGTKIRFKRKETVPLVVSAPLLAQAAKAGVKCPTVLTSIKICVLSISSHNGISNEKFFLVSLKARKSPCKINFKTLVVKATPKVRKCRNLSIWPHTIFSLL